MWPSGNTLHLTPVAWVQLPDPALSSLRQAAILSESVKCVVTSKQWVTAVEYYEGNCRRSDALSHVSSLLSFTGPTGSRLLKQEMSTCPMI